MRRAGLASEQADGGEPPRLLERAPAQIDTPAPGIGRLTIEGYLGRKPPPPAATGRGSVFGAGYDWLQIDFPAGARLGVLLEPLGLPAAYPGAAAATRALQPYLPPQRSRLVTDLVSIARAGPLDLYGAWELHEANLGPATFFFLDVPTNTRLNLLPSANYADDGYPYRLHVHRFDGLPERAMVPEDPADFVAQVLGESHALYAAALADSGRCEDATRSAERTWASRRTLGIPELRILRSVVEDCSVALLNAGNPEAAIEGLELADSLHRAELGGQTEVHGMSHNLRGVALFRAGRRSEAHEAFELAYAMLESDGSPLQDIPLHNLLLLEDRRGERANQARERGMLPDSIHVLAAD